MHDSIEEEHRIRLIQALLLEVDYVSAAGIRAEDGLQCGATLAHEVVHGQRTRRAARRRGIEDAVRGGAEGTVRTAADAVDFSSLVVKFVPGAGVCSVAKVLSQVRGLEAASARRATSKVDNAARGLQGERVLHQLETFLVEALGFEVGKLMLIHLRRGGHVVAARLEEFWEYDRAADLAL